MTVDTNPARITVLIADDHPVVRTGIRSMLSDQGDLEIVGEAADGTEAIALVDTLRPDVVVMDLRMPRVDGVAATRAITQAHPGCRVLILTTYDTDHRY